MDSLSDFLRAKMVRLEAEHPDKMDVVNRAPQLADDLAQLYCELNLLADAIDDGCDQHDDRDEQTADGFDGEHELPPTVASPARQELQLNEQQFAGAVSVATSAMAARSPPGSVDDALRAGSSGHGADTTWVVEVNLSPQLERQLQPDPRDADSVAWIPEVGWDENALCAWVREWDDHAAMWRYTNLDTQQDTWSYPNGVEQFEPVGAADPSHGVEDTDLAEREDTLVSQPDAASTSVTAPQGAYMSLRSPDDDSPLLDNGELEAAVDALERRLATINVAQAGARFSDTAVQRSASGTNSEALEPVEHADADPVDLHTSVVSALADADMLAGDAGQRPSERICQQAATEYRAHLSATGRRQLEEVITASVKAQVELSIAELTNQLS